jgi:ABC-type Fe3+ transport system substrate-binding protein
MLPVMTLKRPAVVRTSSGLTLGFRAACVLLATFGSVAATPAVQAATPTVIVVSPHVSSITHEFGQGFARWHEAQFGEAARVEWRNLGGTSDALKFVQSEFASKPDGIGVDVFFGGGLEPFLLLADKRLLEVCRLPESVLAGLPLHAGGMEIYDPEFRWYGAALSSFGILQNTRVQHRLGLPQVRRWDQLADPRLVGWVGVGDPRNSATMNNMFEAFLQAYGWQRGWELLTCMAGNATKFDRLSSSTAKDVTLGETAYGLAIDFYGFTQVAAAGRTNMTFVLPEDFTAISLDGIAVLRGAPNQHTARRFLEFVLGDAGQKLWHLPKGHPEGAQQYSIERMSVRPGLYERYRDVSNIAYSPFALNQRFRYDTRLARERREVVAALAGAALVDCHPELRAAWRTVIRRGAPADDVVRLGAMPISESEALSLARERWRDPAFRNRLKLDWQNEARARYSRIAARDHAAAN